MEIWHNAYPRGGISSKSVPAAWGIHGVCMSNLGSALGIWDAGIGSNDSGMANHSCGTLRLSRLRRGGLEIAYIFTYVHLIGTRYMDTMHRVPCTVYRVHVPCTMYRVHVPCTVYHVPCTMYHVWLAACQAIYFDSLKAGYQKMA